MVPYLDDQKKLSVQRSFILADCVVVVNFVNSAIHLGWHLLNGPGKHIGHKYLRSCSLHPLRVLRASHFSLLSRGRVYSRWTRSTLLRVYKCSVIPFLCHHHGTVHGQQPFRLDDRTCASRSRPKLVQSIHSSALRRSKVRVAVSNFQKIRTNALPTEYGVITLCSPPTQRQSRWLHCCCTESLHRVLCRGLRHVYLPRTKIQWWKKTIYLYRTCLSMKSLMWRSSEAPSSSGSSSYGYCHVWHCWDCQWLPLSYTTAGAFRV